jgi:hypothetical protein
VTAWVAVRRVPPVTLGLIAATLVLSIAAAIDARMGGPLYEWVALPELLAIAGALLYMDRPHRRWCLRLRLLLVRRRLRAV